MYDNNETPDDNLYQVKAENRSLFSVLLDKHI